MLPSMPWAAITPKEIVAGAVLALDLLTEDDAWSSLVRKIVFDRPRADQWKMIRELKSSILAILSKWAIILPKPFAKNAIIPSAEWPRWPLTVKPTQ